MPRYIKVFEDVLPADICMDLVAKFEADKRVQDDPQPEYSTRRTLFLSDKKEWSRSCMRLATVAQDIVEKYFHRPDEFAETRPASWIDDGYVMACYDKGAICALHADGQCAEAPHNGHRIATLLFFLNTVEQGGEIHFPMQNVKIKPVQGRAIIFPPGYMHPHEVLAPESARYICQTWITDAEMVIQYRDLD